MSAKTKLPVREQLDTDEMTGRFMDDHGDPSEWSQDVALAYAAEVAALRARQLNAKKGAR